MSADRRNFHGRGNDGFACLRCGCDVRPLESGSYRNHCPRCLWSRHVDRVPGDRSEACGGLMEPVRLEGSSTAGWKLTHRCVECGRTRANRAALDDPVQPDSWEALLDLATGTGR